MEDDPCDAWSDTHKRPLKIDRNEQQQDDRYLVTMIVVAVIGGAIIWYFAFVGMGII